MGQRHPLEDTKKMVVTLVTEAFIAARMLPGSN
jgi:hypothetical protein